MSQDLVDRAMSELHLAHVIVTGKVGPAVAEAIPHLLTAVQCWGDALRSQSQADALVDLGKLYDYDIILLDLNLPDMSGYEVLKTLRVSKVATPILILSGLAGIDDKLEAGDWIVAGIGQTRRK